MTTLFLTVFLRLAVYPAVICESLHTLDRTFRDRAFALRVPHSQSLWNIALIQYLNGLNLSRKRLKCCFYILTHGMLWCLGEILQVQESKSDRNLCLFVDCIKEGLESEVDRLCIPFDFNVKQCKERSKCYINVNIDYP